MFRLERESRHLEKGWEHTPMKEPWELRKQFALGFVGVVFQKLFALLSHVHTFCHAAQVGYTWHDVY